ncbi:MAG: hypothetical protein IH968_15230 [Gemmatimonadetes bacterium]|nr:hypothetical protein [Gemmatimonadota bacterium]
MTEGEGHAGTVGVALVTDVFHDDPDGHRLTERLAECRDRGATLAVLPELPLNTWAPASKTPRDEDAEPPNGPRHRLQAEAARAVGISLVGGAIVADPVTGSRHNTAFVFGPDGEVLVETTDPVAVVSVDRDVLSNVREVYPGYLDRPASVYARAWEAVGG